MFVKDSVYMQNKDKPGAKNVYQVVMLLINSMMR